MADETNEQNVTTILSKNEITYQELVNSTLTKILYLIHGTGSDRDRTIQLSTLRRYILEGVSDADFNNLTVSTKIAMNGSPASTEITKGHVKVFTASSVVDLTNEGLSIDGSAGQTTKKTELDDESVKVTGGSNNAELTKLGLNVVAGSNNPETASVTSTSVTITDGSNNDTITLDKNGLSGNVGGDAIEIGKDRVVTAALNITTRTDTNVDYNGLPKQQPVQGTRGDKEGDIVLIHNTDSVGHKVYLNSVSGGSSNYVSVNAGCTIPFVCVAEANGEFYSEWSPMANMQIY